jgi:eukaryotic-like serine/threonine-protein kinase
MSTPDDQRWQELDRLLDEALDVPKPDRASFLGTRVADPDTRAKVERLLLHADGTEELKPGGAFAGDFGEELARDLDSARELSVGERLGPYEILSLLGAGGMGEVYRALDPVLGRQVAIKVLPAEMSDDPARLMRFEREARMLASLNHPHIAAIYGLERHQGRPILVLELVEGETLYERLRKGPLALGHAIEIARQIATALEEAHGKGIVHRDLKPANVKVGEHQRIKVLDFGLAKSAALQGPDEEERDPTRTGMILGTARYMSPEQARGQSVDKRTDIWAFGCVLYEMLTGKSAFAGSTPSDTLAAVLRSEPDWSLLPPETPPEIERMLERCLRKDLRERQQDIGDVRIEIEEWLDRVPEEGYGGVARGRTHWLLSRLAPALVGAAVAGTAATAWFLTAERPGFSGRLLAELLPEPGFELHDDYGTTAMPSPDGESIVYVASSNGEHSLWLRPLGEIEARPLAGTAGGQRPFFSPDGRFLSFFADRKLKRLSLTDGTTETIAEVGDNPRGAAWLDDRTLIMAPSQTSGLVRVHAETGRLEPFTQLDLTRDESSHRWPAALPRGLGVLFTVHQEGQTYDEAEIAVTDIAGERQRILFAGGSHARFHETGGGRGQVLWARAGRLYATPFDAESWSLLGQPQLVVEGVRFDPRNGGAQFAVANNGMLVYRPGPLLPTESRPVWVDRTGRREAVTAAAPRAYTSPRLSPDGRVLALGIQRSGDHGLWLLELEGGAMNRLTFAASHSPVWSRDGQFLVYAAPNPEQLNLFAARARGAAQTWSLGRSELRQYPNSMSPDSRLLIFQERRPATGWDLLTLQLDDEGRPEAAARVLLDTPANETHGVLSPDGNLLAYESDELDSVVQVYVATFPDLGRRARVSMSGGREPVWSGDGRLYFWDTTNDQLIEASLENDASAEHLAVTERSVILVSGETLWRTNLSGFSSSPGFAGYQVAAGVDRFLMLEPHPLPEFHDHGIVVLVNWLDRPR